MVPLPKKIIAPVDHRRLARISSHLLGPLSPVAPSLVTATEEIPPPRYVRNLRRPLGGGSESSLGAEVEIDVTDPCTFTPETGRYVRDLLVRHGVLNIRTGDKPLDEATFKRVCRLLGPIKSFTGQDTEGKTIRYDQDMQVVDPSAKVRTAKGTRGGKRFGAWEFHSDDSYMTLPGRFTCLHPQELPPSGGGETGILDMRQAWRLLPDEMKEKIGRLRAVHHHNNHGLFNGVETGLAPTRQITRSETDPGNQLVEAVHPLVRSVTETGDRALYLNLNRMRGVVGLETSAAVQLLTTLQRHAEENVLEYLHKWRHGDILVWDNASVQHRAHDTWPMAEPRRMIRYMVDSEEPAGGGES